MTFAEIAASVGVSEATLSRHEHGLGASPTFVRPLGDDLMPCNDLLEETLDRAERALAADSAVPGPG